MRCGEKRYQVTYEQNGERKVTIVSARTPAEARKVFRKARSTDVTIVSVVAVAGAVEVEVSL